MNQTPPAPDAPVRKRRLVDLAPLKASPVFARLWIGGVIAGVGAQMSIVAVVLQIYHITGSTFMVGLVGGVALLPMIVAGLWGGMIADVWDRRRILIVASLLGWSTTLALVALSLWDARLEAGGGNAAVWPFYVITTVNAVAATVAYATRGAIVGRILPTELISRATALNGIGFGLMLTVGPALAGALVASVGFAWTYAVDALLFSAGFLGVWMLPTLPRIGEKVEAGWGVLREGMSFLKRAPNIRMSFIVDLLAMTFGRPYVLFPALGALVVGGGALTVGALTVAGAVGTMLVSLFSGFVGRVHRHGVAIERSIAVFGGFVLMFGLVVLAVQWTGHSVEAGLGGAGIAEGWGSMYWPGFIGLALAVAGMMAADEVSAIFRSTILIQAAPDQMRGRLQGVFIVVVSGGPRIGDMYGGILATAVALWFPPLLGGLLIMALVGVFARLRFRARGVKGEASFRDYDARTPTP